MFVKSMKKSIALCIAIVFVLLILPMTGMAQEQSATVKMINCANTRGGTYASQYGLTAYTANPNTLKVQNGTGNNIWGAYAQFDLSGYEEILANSGTTAEFGITVGGHASTTKQRDFEIYIMSDSCDKFDANTLSYNLAEQLGLHNTKDNGVLIGSVKEDEAYSVGAPYSVEIPVQTILKILRQGADNSIITVVFTTTDADGTFFLKDSGVLTINHKDSLIDNAAYAKEVADEINWEQLSLEAQNNVTQNLTLPTKLYGADISWVSSNPGVVTSDGTVTQTYEKEQLTLTATVAYKGETANAAFNITVANKTYEFTDVNTGEAAFYNVPSNASAKIKVASNVPGIYGKDASDVIYNVHDISSTDGTMLNYMVSNSDPTLNNDVMEFSICLPAGSPDVIITAGVLNATGNTGAGTQTDKIFTMTTNGFYFGNQKIYETKANQWYTMAFVAPKGMATVGTPTDEDDKTGEVYVNGELVNVMTFNTPTSYGFRYFRFYGNDSALTDTGYYLDNVRWHSGEYLTQYDAPAVINSDFTSKTKDTITLKEATVSSVKAAIETADDTVIRIYDTNQNLVTDENAAVETGYTLVATAKNGTDMERSYSYMNIKVTGSSCAFDIPAINVENSIAKSEIKLYNNSNEDANYTAYLAIYYGGELLRVVPVPVTADSGKISVTPIEAPISQGNTAKLMVWKDLVPQFVASEK